MAVIPTTGRQLFTRGDLENRVSKEALRRITDDNKSGAPDPSVVQQLIKDASATVFSYVPTLVIATDDPVPDYIIKLALDIGQALLYIRFPLAARQEDGFAMLAIAKADLRALSVGQNQVPPPGGGTDPETGDGEPTAAQVATFGTVVSTPFCRNRRL